MLIIKDPILQEYDTRKIISIIEVHSEAYLVEQTIWFININWCKIKKKNNYFLMLCSSYWSNVRQKKKRKEYQGKFQWMRYYADCYHTTIMMSLIETCVNTRLCILLRYYKGVTELGYIFLPVKSLRFSGNSKLSSIQWYCSPTAESRAFPLTIQ